MATDARSLGAGGALALAEAEREIERLRAELAAVAVTIEAIAAGLDDAFDQRPRDAGTHVVEHAAHQLRATAKGARRA